jgi:hypothetical protein
MDGCSVLPAIRVHSGVLFNPFDPDPDLVSFDDITHALSMICRYAGHCDIFYSVGEHASYVSDCALERYGDHELALAALHHDDPEAYLGDMPRPYKRLFGTGKYEEPILAIIHEKLGLREPAYYHERIKECDNAVLRTEVEQIASRPSDRFQWFESTNLGDFERWEGCILGVNPRSAMEMYRARDRELRRL